MKLTLWVLLCAIASPVLAIEPDGARKLVRIRKSEIESYLVLGILDFAEQRVSFDLPKAVVGDEIRAVVRMRNSGDTPVAIKSIESSCGCTTAMRATDKPIAPGTEERLIVSVDTIKPGAYGLTLSIRHGDEKSVVVLGGWVCCRSL